MNQPQTLPRLRPGIPSQHKSNAPTPETSAWWAIPTTTLTSTLATDVRQGLDEREAARRLDDNGANELVERGLKSFWRIVWEQISAIMIVILIIASLIKVALGEYIDAGAIGAIVILNIVLGVFQEYRAEHAMAALKKLATPVVRVRRNFKTVAIPARELVPGDVILVEAGTIVPADARLVETANLRVQEASLTGESLPVDKNTDTLAEETVLADRYNMLYLGTTVTYGRGTAVVTDTGMNTELGRIATLLQTVSADPTPLQRRIHQLGITLAIAALVIVLAVIGLGLINGRGVVEMFLAGVAIAVAAIPEGLPAVLTITLALGAQRMLRRGALIRKLPAVETLGSVTVICSDKTGTLTENKMKVTWLDVAGHSVNLTETMVEGHPITTPTSVMTPLPHVALPLLVTGAVLCNDAELEQDEGTNQYTAKGDPTEGALLVAGAQYGLWKTTLESWLPRVAEVPFTSERKRMTTAHRVLYENVPQVAGAPLQDVLAHTPYVAFTKGGVDGLLSVCDTAWEEGQIVPLSAVLPRIEQASDQLAAQGLRVLGVAFKPLNSIPAQMDESIEQGLTFVGMVGMIDPPRAEVKAAVQTCHQAGIRTVMITGDHPLTARQIAQDLQIINGTGRVLTGQALSELDPAQFTQAVEEVSVFARVAPEQKLEIVQALQSRGHVVAMTGDGVNDAPALRRADIGVAMGITGTDVSKEAANMVITDDNFSTIVSAVEEGRTIYDNVRKFVKYIVTSNTGEVLVMFLTQLMGMPLPMTTLQILWMNLVTDGLPGLALGLEPTERSTMRRAPHAPDENIFSRGLGQHVMTVGPVLAIVAFLVGYTAWLGGNPAWGTMVFVTLTLSQLGHALAVRSNTESLFRIGVGSNPLLLLAVVATLVLQLLVVYFPPFQSLFETVPLTASDLLLCLVASTVVFWVVELEKLWLRRRASDSNPIREA